MVHMTKRDNDSNSYYNGEIDWTKNVNIQNSS